MRYTLRILVVEDSAERIQTIREWLPQDVRATFASSGGMAMGTLKRDARLVAGVMLDHDLQEQALTESDFVLSGSALVETIVQAVPRHVPVLIHSMNARGAQAMARRLHTAGFSVTRVPMADLTREILEAWVEDVRDNWDPG